MSGSGFNKGLISETIFDVHKIYKMNKSETEDQEPLTQDEVTNIMTDNFYNKLAMVSLKIFSAESAIYKSASIRGFSIIDEIFCYLNLWFINFGISKFKNY